jgi:hypothetical protein
MVDWNLSPKQITSTIGQIAARMTFAISRSKTLVTWSRRSGTFTIIGWLLFLTQLGNVAAADPTSAAQTVLSQAKSQIQSMVISMSEGCSGGAHGVPPVSWLALQPHGDSAVNALSDASVDLADKDKAKALQHINIAEGELESLLNGVRGNCSGGAHGIDPVGISGYLATKAAVQGRLHDVKIFLED